MPPYPTYRDGTDFFGSDVNSMIGTEEECVAACVADVACYALVIKDTSVCWLKDSTFNDIEPVVVAETIAAVDLSCLRDGDVTPPGAPTNLDNTYIGGDFRNSSKARTKLVNTVVKFL